MLRNMCNLAAHPRGHRSVRRCRAKELRRVAEPLITLAKEPTVANRRLAFDRLRDRDVVDQVLQRRPPLPGAPGRLHAHPEDGLRVGDNAPMAYVELVDRSEPVSTEPAAADKADQGSTRREILERPACRSFCCRAAPGAELASAGSTDLKVFASGRPSGRTPD